MYVHACMYVCLPVCKYACMYVWLNVILHVCVCEYACMYVRMYVCGSRTPRPNRVRDRDLTFANDLLWAQSIWMDLVERQDRMDGRVCYGCLCRLSLLGFLAGDGRGGLF